MDCIELVAPTAALQLPGFAAIEYVRRVKDNDIKHIRAVNTLRGSFIETNNYSYSHLKIHVQIVAWRISSYTHHGSGENENNGIHGSSLQTQ